MTVVPAGLRWVPKPDALGGVLRSPWSQRFLLGLVLPALATASFLLFDHPKGPTGSLMLAASALVCFFLFVRSLANEAKVWFEDGVLHAVEGPLWPRVEVRHPVVDIVRFAVLPRLDGDVRRGFVLGFLTRTGAVVTLPLEVPGATWSIGSDAVPRARAAYLAAFLDDALETVRHEGGSYRLGPAEVRVATSASAEGLDEPDAIERRGRRRS